jgi:hypothetical protein
MIVGSVLRYDRDAQRPLEISPEILDALDADTQPQKGGGRT